MGALDRAFPKVAQKLVKAFGTSVTVQILSVSSYDPATRAATTSTASTTLDGVLERYHFSELGDQVKDTDYKLHIAANQITTQPKNGDLAVVNGNTMRIESVMTEYAGGTAALYTLQVRG